jgi:hypothetical protein
VSTDEGALPGFGEVRAYASRVATGSAELWKWKLVDDLGSVHGESTDPGNEVDDGLYDTRWLAVARGRNALCRFESQRRRR